MRPQGTGNPAPCVHVHGCLSVLLEPVPVISDLRAHDLRVQHHPRLFLGCVTVLGDHPVLSDKSMTLVDLLVPQGGHDLDPWRLLRVQVPQHPGRWTHLVDGGGGWFVRGTKSAQPLLARSLVCWCVTVYRRPCPLTT